MLPLPPTVYDVSPGSLLCQTNTILTFNSSKLPQPPRESLTKVQRWVWNVIKLGCEQERGLLKSARSFETPRSEIQSQGTIRETQRGDKKLGSPGVAIRQ